MLSKDFLKKKRKESREKVEREWERKRRFGWKEKRKMAEQDTLRRFMAGETNRRKGTQLFSY